MAVHLTGFGGVGEIGGNAFLLEASGLRVMLDMGKRFGAAETGLPAGGRRPGFGDYFDTFQKPRTANVVGELGTLDLIPYGGAMRRLYRPDLGGDPGEPPVDLALVSHPHIDHCGLLGLLRRDVPVGLSPQAYATLASMEATGTGTWESDFTDLRLRGSYLRNAKERLTDLKYQPDEVGSRRTFVTAGALPADKEWDITFHAVDHSIQGAGGFVLSDGDTKIVYSGDFRRHGSHPERTREFLKAAAAPDVLIMEGTRVGHAGHAPHAASDDRKESDVEQDVVQLVEGAQSPSAFVGIGYPPRDLDRMGSLLNAARRLGRRLLIGTKQAHLLDELRAAGHPDVPDWRSDPNLGVLLRSNPLLQEPGRVPVGDKVRFAVESIQVSVAEWQQLVSRSLERWEFRMLGGEDEKRGAERAITKPVPVGEPHIVSTYAVGREPGLYLMSLSLYTMTDLFDVFPDRQKAGGLYIHSQTQPHNDDMEMDQYRLRRWLRAFNLNAPDHEPRRTHVSGHLSEADVQDILDELRPKVLVPIHSEHPGLTADRYRERTGLKALLPRPGWRETVA